MSSWARKLLEWDELKASYPALMFHTDWALHVKMDRRYARQIIEEFEKANMHFRQGIRPQDLLAALRNEIRRISLMESFEEELTRCLERYQLPPLTFHRAHDWVHFLHLYARVVEDCPLIASGVGGTLAHVTVQLEMAREPVKHEDGEDMAYTVKWLIKERGGKTGELFVINSFSLHGPQASGTAQESGRNDVARS